MNLLPPISRPCCSARRMRAMTPISGRSLSDALVYSWILSSTCKYPKMPVSLHAIDSPHP
jgi:hypothetical protein